ncbi:hypothetical protein B1H18_17520 [Streptomyces tsukubensis]|uniref:Uncharacterized protein n=1 Tax=Streptomyces tsukubensis TaxID=83656 RepID=A0A1V4A8C6_9ACTN|nr:hypothetical protein B1H18_17520 [Streptomyces tsukubensis]
MGRGAVPCLPRCGEPSPVLAPAPVRAPAPAPALAPVPVRAPAPARRHGRLGRTHGYASCRRHELTPARSSSTRPHPPPVFVTPSRAVPCPGVAGRGGRPDG